jgi:S1-C subfamily serine protease
MPEVAAELVDQVAQIKSKLTEIRTRDGRVFKTQELQSVDPSGLKFFGNSGVARVKFSELPPDVAQKLGWDRQKAMEHEEKLGKEQAAQDSKRREYEQAQSMVESLHYEAKIKPILKVNAGWLCAVSERKKVQVEVVTGSSYNPLSNTEKIFTENREVDVSGPAKMALVWGLSDRVVVASQHAAISSQVFVTGKYKYSDRGSEGEAPIYHTDRTAAIRHLMKFGYDVVYDDDMKPTEGGQKGSLLGFGSGFFVSKEGHIATNHHVIEGARTITVSTGGKIYDARLVTSDEDHDLAVLKIDYEPKVHLPISTMVAHLGDKVFTIGFPRPTTQGKNAKYTDGSISSLTGLRDSADQYQISVPIQPGNSGGALVNDKGKVVGVIVSTLNPKIVSHQNVNYAIKAEHLVNLCRKVGGATLVVEEASATTEASPPADKNGKSWEEHISTVENAAVLIRIEG